MHFLKRNLLGRKWKEYKGNLISDEHMKLAKLLYHVLMIDDIHLTMRLKL